MPVSRRDKRPPNKRYHVYLFVGILGILALFPIAARAVGYTPEQVVTLSTLLIEGLATLAEMHFVALVAAVLITALLLRKRS